MIYGLVSKPRLEQAGLTVYCMWAAIQLYPGSFSGGIQTHFKFFAFIVFCELLEEDTQKCIMYFRIFSFFFSIWNILICYNIARMWVVKQKSISAASSSAVPPSCSWTWKVKTSFSFCGKNEFSLWILSCFQSMKSLSSKMLLIVGHYSSIVFLLKSFY